MFRISIYGVHFALMIIDNARYIFFNAFTMNFGYAGKSILCCKDKMSIKVVVLNFHSFIEFSVKHCANIQTNKGIR